MDPVAHFLFAVAVIVLVSHVLGALLGRLGQPPIIGEIIGGLLLGPSLFGALWPSGRDWIFPPDLLRNLDLAAQLGLVTFMFLLGCELQLTTVRRQRKVVASVVVGSVGLPLVVGMVIAYAARDLMAASTSHPTAYMFFFGLAISITALPVLARILVDLGLDNSQMGALALACAAIGDGITWGALTVTLGLLTLADANHLLETAGLGLILVLVTVLLVKPALAKIVRTAEERPHSEGRLILSVLVAGALGAAAITQLLGLHPVIGAFLFGTIVPRGSALVERVCRQLQGFTLAVLLPLFFAGVGMRTSVGLLGTSPQNWLLFAVVLVAAVGTKFVGAGAGARLAGLPATDALRLGTLMNCRGVTELVVATIGWQYHLINELGLTILVLIALITTGVTSPVMRLLKTPSDALINTRSITAGPSMSSGRTLPRKEEVAADDQPLRKR
ncbi:hypothetical protein Acor_78160 [Acrocarpospora corrugata]|uniref:Cation/H+ exchanger transmembrane domain-containing protein n=1 Tax=Acrocarpospora corrugata TaxID=35763 RepID=A0A5M3W9K9_9ACTN|nr:cation:proton antiporter [Acrocarpospora corrugata]GES05747.1 hypothetical protein Acor_78160 [Acrocarpospora corrugata]